MKCIGLSRKSNLHLNDSNKTKLSNLSDSIIIGNRGENTFENNILKQ